MSSAEPSRLWSMRAAFTVLALLILFASLIPLETKPPRYWAGIDLLMIFAMAWSLRRPEFVPPLLLALIFLLADLLLQRPPGLWALLTLIACESLKGRIAGLRGSGFAAEYLSVAMFITGIYVANWVILTILLVHVAPLGLYAVQLLATVIAYPIVVFVTYALMGVRRATPGDTATGGLGA